MQRQRAIGARLWSGVIWTSVGFFLLNLLALIAAVLVNSLGTHWFDTWLPPRFTTHWYADAWEWFQLPAVLAVTAEVAGAVVAISGLVGVPAAYAMARRDFMGKRVVMVLFLLPLMVPPITYGIPLAAMLYHARLAGRLSGVILANLVPAVPFVILVMMPFVEQIDSRVEGAARTLGAGTGRLLLRVVVPLLMPGVLASLLLVLVRTIGMFELTFFTAGPTSQTLVVALYYAVFSAGVRPTQSIDAMAVIYMLTTLAWLLIALRFVRPTQIFAGARES
jgi:putative spermidine/putrescine transport system permease protein